MSPDVLWRVDHAYGGQPATKRLGLLLSWLATTVLALVGLHLAGRGVLSPPPLTSPSGWSGWLQQRDPVVAAFAVLRVLALGFGWYAVAVTVAGVTARLASRRRLVAAVDRLTVPPLRRVLAATVSLSLSAGMATPAVAATDRPPVRVVGDTQAPTTTAPRITMRELPPSSEPAPAEAPPPGAQRTWTVEPGQCFWSIAEAVLAERSGHQPSDSDIVPYWHRLIDVNRPALRDPQNPDLIYPGQVFTVP